jgi:hypothetical protein
MPVFVSFILKLGVNRTAAGTASELVRGEEAMPLCEPGEPVSEDGLHHFAEALLLRNLKRQPGSRMETDDSNYAQ